MTADGETLKATGTGWYGLNWLLARSASISFTVSPGISATSRRFTAGSAIRAPLGPGVVATVTTHSKLSLASA